MKVFLPEPKVLDLIKSCQAILSMTPLTARSPASLQGKMSSCLHAVLPALTFYRAIQADIHQATGKASNFNKILILSSEAICGQKGGGGGEVGGHHATNAKLGAGGLQRRPPPHKHFRAKGSPFCSEIICKIL